IRLPHCAPNKGNGDRSRTALLPIVDLARRRDGRSHAMKAIVLTCDRFRAMTEHMILRYQQLWPDHPFIFRVPYQNLRGTETPRTEYTKTPDQIRATVLELIADLDDEEGVYWCIDDKYPIRLIIDKIETLMADALQSPEISGLLFCRFRVTLSDAKLTLDPGKIGSKSGDV